MRRDQLGVLLVGIPCSFGLNSRLLVEHCSLQPARKWFLLLVEGFLLVEITDGLSFCPEPAATSRHDFSFSLLNLSCAVKQQSSISMVYLVVT
ncbi:hypothetical protein PVAP13_9KG153585 [Panicum virgatum]|uniref:Uncharacterized protein n=1 Tax=Panicum virgatum TaxID=38727 RepID=A0A8T0NFT9_PANVG|nr:hypothetical protein PVAP13_9KG153585 [Panicum virgatum]